MADSRSFRKSITMVVMKKSEVFVALGGLTLALSGLTWFGLPWADAAELNGFAINTQDKAVTVTLFTDQRANYTTEHQGKQFTIVLPNTQLSQEQIDNGLPVVIDNKNRFIGRAVPGEDGKVKIILPNLPANEYSVSVQQKRPGQAAAAHTSIENLKPRPIVKPAGENRFEQVAANFPRPVQPAPVVNHAGPLKLTSISTNRANRGNIWNPYVYNPSDFSRTANGVTLSRPARGVKKVAKSTAPMDFQPEPVSTVSVAESLQPAASQAPVQPAGNKDPLWYLHALPPANSAVTSGDNLQGLASQALPSAESAKANPAESKPEKVERFNLAEEFKAAFKTVPRWLVVTISLFLSGMGLFTLIGGLVLLKILFTQRQPLHPNLPYVAGVVPMYAPPDTSLDFSASLKPRSKASYASHPSYGQASLRFEDKASVQALDYLKQNSASVAQAVQNAALVKFPATRKHRAMSQRKAT